MPTETDTEVSEDESPVIRELRERAKRADEATAQAESLLKENTILRAGLNDLTPLQVKAITATHEGEWTVDAIKATATDLGFGAKPQSPEVPQQVPQQELDAIQRVQEAGNSVPSPPDPGLDAVINGQYNSLEELDAALTTAGMLTNVRDL